MSNLAFLSKYSNILSKYAEDNHLPPEKDKSDFEAELEEQLVRLEKENYENSLSSTYLNHAYDQYIHVQPEARPLETQFFSNSSEGLNKQYGQLKDRDVFQEQDQLQVTDIVSHPEAQLFLSSHFALNEPILLKHFVRVTLHACEIHFKTSLDRKTFKNFLKDKLTTKNPKELSLNALEIQTKDNGIYAFIEEIVKATLKESEKNEKTKLHNQIVNELEMVKQMLDQKKIEVSEYEMNVLNLKNGLGESMQQQYNMLVKLMEDSFQQKLQYINKRVSSLENSLKSRIRMIEQKGQAISKRNVWNEQESQKQRQKISQLEKQLEYSKQRTQDLEGKLGQERQAHASTSEKLQQKIRGLEKKVSKAQSEMSSLSQQSTMLVALGDVSNVQEKKSERSVLSPGKKEEEMRQSKVRGGKQSDEYLPLLFSLMARPDPRASTELHMEILPFIASEHPAQMVWLVPTLYEELCHSTGKFQPKSSLWKKRLKGSTFEKELVSILKGYSESKLAPGDHDEYCAIQSKECCGLIILKLASHVSEQVFALNVLARLVMQEQNDIYSSQLKNDYVQRHLVATMMEVVKLNPKHQDLALAATELLLELATQGFHYQDFLTQTSSQLPTLTDMIKLNLTNLPLCEKISIVIQRVVFNQPTLMDPPLKDVVNQLAAKDLTGYNLLDCNVKSLLNL